MAPLIEEAREARQRSADARFASASLRARSRSTLGKTRRTVRETSDLRGHLVVRSPWSDLRWRLPGRELDHVLVPVRGGLAPPDEA